MPRQGHLYRALLPRGSLGLELAVGVCGLGPAPRLGQQISPGLLFDVAALERGAIQSQLGGRLRRLRARRHGKVQMLENLHPFSGWPA